MVLSAVETYVSFEFPGVGALFTAKFSGRGSQHDLPPAREEGLLSVPFLTYRH